MQITDKQYDLIQKFMRNELNESEQTLFNESLKNLDFKKELNDQARILNAIETSKDQELRSFLNDIDVSELGETKSDKSTSTKISEPKGKVLPSWLKYALILIIVISTFFLIRNSLSKQSEPDLFAAYYEKPMAMNGRGTTGDVIFSKAIVAYQEGNFAESNAQLSTLSENNNDALYYASISKLELGKYREAIAGFKTLKTKNTKYSSDADWFMALTYLKMNKVNDCKDQLNLIVSDSNHPYKTKATQLLASLK